MYVQCMPGSMGAPGRVVVIWATFGGQRQQQQSSPLRAARSRAPLCVTQYTLLFVVYMYVCCVPAFCMCCGCVSVWRRALTHTRSLDSAYAIANVCLCICVCVCKFCWCSLPAPQKDPAKNKTRRRIQEKAYKINLTLLFALIIQK